MFFAIFTNGIGLDKSIAEVARKNGNVGFFLSCNGINEESNKTRGEGSYAFIDRSMKILHDTGVPFAISFTVMKENYLHISDPDVIHFFENRGAVSLFYISHIPANGNRLMPDSVQQIELSNRLNIKTKVILFNYADLTTFGYCRAGYRHVFIDADGTVSPCFTMGINMGNVHKRTLEEIITSDFSLEYRKLKKHVGPLCMAMHAPREVLELARKMGISETNPILHNFC
jgi:sulfatase maturation enzyme AslB (radical SAM superfamily)